MELLQQQNHNNLEQKQEELFPGWFASRVSYNACIIYLLMQRIIPGWLKVY